MLNNADRAQTRAVERAAMLDRVKALSGKLDRATFATKRKVIELLDVRVKLGRRESGKRFGYVSSLL